MNPVTSQPGQGDGPVRLLGEEVVFEHPPLFRVWRASLQYRRFDGRMSAVVTRISFERGDSVGVLLYDPHDDAVVLVRQFRYPVYAGLDPEQRGGAGAWQAWLLEVVAGVKDAGLSTTAVAHNELLEEAGYRVAGDLQPIATFYASPGGSSERIHLFVAAVDSRRQAAPGGGVVAEGEDTQIVAMPLREALAMIARGEICDAKTIIALQHLALRRVRTK